MRKSYHSKRERGFEEEKYLFNLCSFNKYHGNIKGYIYANVFGKK